ncbi:MAG: 2-amino-4-hydroxy-6-hydroxymethyldihydropteridine diphosphokinase [Actinomycetota bacterium]
MTTAFLGLGSNLGDRLGRLTRAVAALGREGVVVTAISSVYETEAVGPPQPDFLNAACRVETDLAARELLALIKRLERELGRGEGERWGAREIDIDLLLYGEQSIDEEGLVVPHPELTKRAFVLVPVLEIEPFVELPSGEPLSAFLERDPKGIRSTEGTLGA